MDVAGDSKTLLMACASPEHTDVSETNCTLMFAKRATAVEMGTATRKQVS